MKNMPVDILPLSQIENPRFCGVPIKVEGIVSSSSLTFFVPHFIKASWTKQGVKKENTITFEKDNPQLLRFIDISGETAHRKIASLLGIPKNVHFKVEERVNYIVYKIRLRPPILLPECRKGQVGDKVGHEFKHYEIYIIVNEKLSLPPSTKIIVTGVPIPDPKTQSVTFQGFEVDFPDKVERYNLEALRDLFEFFNSLSVSERLNWILNNFEIYSRIVDRRNIAFAGFLCYFTPLWIEIDGDVQRGWALVLIIGDTTTGKSEIARKLGQLLGAGLVITAETASAVGLTAAVIQAKGGRWFVDWGFLPLSDGKLLAIDGSQKLSSNEWATLAEAERQGKVIISKAAKDSAPARTRLIMIANPVKKGRGDYNTRRISDFSYPIKAVNTVLDKTSIARRDLVIIVDRTTVDVTDINRRQEDDYDPKLHLFKEVLKWCWSGKAKVVFDEEAVIYLNEVSTRLYRQFYSSGTPLVDVNFKWKLARLSASLAHMTLSTSPEFDIVTVTKEHVQEIVRFIEKEYSNAGLDKLAQFEKSKSMNLNTAISLIEAISKAVNEQPETAIDILLWLNSSSTVSRENLRSSFQLTDNSQLRPLIKALRDSGLIPKKKGFTPRTKLVSLCRLLEDPEMANKIIISIKCENEIPNNNNDNNRESSFQVDNLDEVDTTPVTAMAQIPI